MDLREALNKNPAVATGLAIAIVVVAVGLMIWSMSGGSGGGAGVASGDAKQYFTIDDGKTWFEDSYSKLTPFDKDGKQAVVAHVYRDVDNKQDFVAYMSRLTPEGRKIAEERAKRAAAGEFGSVEGIIIPMEYKRPGEAAWLKGTDPRASAMINEVKSPKGSVNVEPVFPE